MDEKLGQQIKISLMKAPAELAQFYPFFSQVIKKDFPGYSKAVVKYFLTKVYQPAAFNYWLTSGWKLVFLAKKQKAIVGFAVVDKPYGGVCFVRWLGVKEKQRRQGIGRALIGAIIAYAKKYGVHKVELASQPKTKAFYQKLSLTLEGKRKQSYFGIDQFIFGKVLGRAKDKVMTRD